MPYHTTSHLVKGNQPAGGNVLFADGHTSWRLFRSMKLRYTAGSRPDFALVIYPGGVAGADGKLSPELTVTANTPPAFIVQAEDDSVRVENSIAYYMALKRAGVPVEMHLYAQGGHAYGLRRTKLPITEWPQLVEKWLGTTGMTSD